MNYGILDELPREPVEISRLTIEVYTPSILQTNYRNFYYELPFVVLQHSNDSIKMKKNMSYEKEILNIGSRVNLLIVSNNRLKNTNQILFKKENNIITQASFLDFFCINFKTNEYDKIEIKNIDSLSFILYNIFVYYIEEKV